MNIIKNKCFPYIRNNSEENPLCCVLTDKHFFIQSFTPNSFEYLGLNTKDIDSNLNITECISQFGYELLKNIDEQKESTEINDIFNYSSNTNIDNNKSFYNSNTLKSEKRLKRELTKKRYSLPQLISWKYDHQLKETNDNKELLTKLTSELLKKKKKKSMEKKLFLQIKETKMNGMIVGYKFLFKKMRFQKDPSQRNKSIMQTDIWDSELSELNSNGNNNIIYSPTLTLKSNIKDALKKVDSSLIFFNSDQQISHKLMERHSQDVLYNKYNINTIIKELKINKNFVPKDSSNFIFDLEKMSFLYNSKIKGNDNLINALSHEAKEKVYTIKSLSNTSKNFLNTLEKKKSDSNEEANSSSDSSSGSSEGSSSSYSSSFDNISNNNKEFEEENGPEPDREPESVAHSEPDHKHYRSFMIQYKNKNPTLMKIPKYKNLTTKSHFGKKKSIKDQPLYEKISNQIKERNSVAFIFKYYEVNIKNIRFLKYDFYKETIVEDHHSVKMNQMTQIINEIKSNLDKLEHKDSNYPSINFEHFAQIKSLAISL